MHEMSSKEEKGEAFVKDDKEIKSHATILISVMLKKLWIKIKIKFLWYLFELRHLLE